jgi:hypothetical protein
MSERPHREVYASECVLRVDAQQALICAVGVEALLSGPSLQEERGIDRQSGVPLGQHKTVSVGVVGAGDV